MAEAPEHLHYFPPAAAVVFLTQTLVSCSVSLRYFFLAKLQSPSVKCVRRCEGGMGCLQSDCAGILSSP